MVKKRVVLLFLIIISFTFGQLTIDNMRFNSSPSQFVLDISGEGKPDYLINYDKTTRLLFLEVTNGKLSNEVKAIVERNDGYIENVVSMDLGDGRSNFFLTLGEGVSYKDSLWTNPTRVVLNFEKERSSKPLVVIDAGHGGKDPGAIGGSYREKDIVLKVALKLGKELEKDFNVSYTRANDSFISLGDRSKVANKKVADLFVSIHANSSRSTNATGVEVFYYSKTESAYAKQIAEFENSVDEKFGIKESEADFIVSDITYNQNKERSLALAKNMVGKLAKTTGFKNRGIHGANFAVLRGSESPAVLVELGFISNPSEAKKMATGSYQDKMAKMMADSIREYFK